MTITSLDGYRWLKNDIILVIFQWDAKITNEFAGHRVMHLALGRYGSSFATGGTAGHGGESKGYRVASMSEQELLDIFDAGANTEAMLVSLAIARGGDEWEADVLGKSASAE